MNGTRQGLGVVHLSNGSNYYKSCLKWHTSLNITPEAVHQKGLDEVHRIADEMKKVNELILVNNFHSAKYFHIFQQNRFI